SGRRGPHLRAPPTKRPSEDAHTPSIIPLAPLTGEGCVTRHTFQTGHPSRSSQCEKTEPRPPQSTVLRRRLACGQDLGGEAAAATATGRPARQHARHWMTLSLLPGLF
ncbi:unnamed protein product, partial [Ixodes hexagonus]